MLYRLSVISNELITEDRMDNTVKRICTAIDWFSYLVIAAATPIVLVMFYRVAHH